MSAVRGKVAAVTGAASGIGRALALGLAARGARLALADVDDEGLAATATLAREAGADVVTAHVDVADREAVLAWAADVAGRFGVVHHVYANAGITFPAAPVLDAPWAAYDRVLAVDLLGVIATVKAFLPHLVASGDGHVVTLSSLGGIAAQPGLSAYSAAKSGVRGFTETLRSEMLAARLPVQVTVVHPGGVRTGIARRSLVEAEHAGADPSPAQRERARLYEKRLLRMPPEQAARIILDGVERGDPRVLVGSDAKVVDLLVRLFPRHYPRFGAWFDARVLPLSAGRFARR